MRTSSLDRSDERVQVVLPAGSDGRRSVWTVGDEQCATVRPMGLADVELRINYFHGSSDEHLHQLGVDRALLPARDAWRAFYEEDYSRPLHERVNYSLAWEFGGSSVGFSSTDRIVFGEEAFMHLHIVAEPLRARGLGTQFVRMSTQLYFRDLQLKRLYCEPNAFNVAPNRTLQRAGFRYVFSHEAAPSSINFMQVTTRWVLDEPQVTDFGI